jgi:hypothetical protein
MSFCSSQLSSEVEDLFYAPPAWNTDRLRSITTQPRVERCCRCDKRIGHSTLWNHYCSVKCYYADKKENIFKAAEKVKCACGRLRKETGMATCQSCRSRRPLVVVEKLCVYCGKVFSAKSPKAKSCSRKCTALASFHRCKESTI